MVYLSSNVRAYGSQPYGVVLLHGGPGASGEMAPVAKELSQQRGVLEPLQSAESIEGQVQELRALLEKYSQPPVILVGFSWGAWLGLIFTARYPELVGKLILIGSAPFEEKYAQEIINSRLERMSPKKREEVLVLMQEMEKGTVENKGVLMGRLGKLLDKADSFDAVLQNSEIIECNYDIFSKVWNEASRMRSSGELLEMGRKIKCPVLAIHGDYDPHPYWGVREPLSRVIKDFRFVLLEKCGHKPWTERLAKDKFYELLRSKIGI